MSFPLTRLGYPLDEFAYRVEWGLGFFPETNAWSRLSGAAKGGLNVSQYLARSAAKFLVSPPPRDPNHTGPASFGLTTCSVSFPVSAL